ncbi:hypothetical protein ABKN59_002467 [Abortiporus biennis]
MSMPLKIRIPKVSDPGPSQLPTASASASISMSRRRAQSKRYEWDRREKRTRVDEDVSVAEELEASVYSQGAQDEAEVQVDIEDETYSQQSEDRSYPEPKPSKRKRKDRAYDLDDPPPRSLASSSKRRSTAKAKRAVVYSDDEDDGGDFEPESQLVDIDDNDDFEPERPPLKKMSSSKGKAGGVGKIPTIKITKNKAGKDKGVEKQITMRDERKMTSPLSTTPSTSISKESTKRSRPLEDESSLLAFATTSELTKPEEAEPIPPPPKKIKLPTIKKNKQPASSTTPSTPGAKPTAKKKPDPIRPTIVERKPAATANNADFDLRDASVYAQLFNKPAGSTPNSGLNRREKEEARRKELNKMREDARAKRAEEAKQSFDLQSAHDKIAKFEEKLRLRRSMAIYPNILGSVLKENYERRLKQRQRERDGR